MTWWRYPRPPSTAPHVHALPDLLPEHASTTVGGIRWVNFESVVAIVNEVPGWLANSLRRWAAPKPTDLHPAASHGETGASAGNARTGQAAAGSSARSGCCVCYCDGWTWAEGWCAAVTLSSAERRVRNSLRVRWQAKCLWIP